MSAGVPSLDKKPMKKAFVGCRDPSGLGGGKQSFFMSTLRDKSSGLSVISH